MSYTVLGLDLGSHSTGMALVEFDSNKMPSKLLKSVSVIHDGGQDGKASRKAKAGAARRQKNRYRNLRKNRQNLRNALRDNGYPYTETDLRTVPRDWYSSGHDMWDVRADLAMNYVSDPVHRAHAVAAAALHLQKHRGQRNVWLPATRVFADAETGYSTSHEQMLSRFAESTGADISALSDATPSMVVHTARAAGKYVGGKAASVTTRKWLAAQERKKARESEKKPTESRTSRTAPVKDKEIEDTAKAELDSRLITTPLRRSDIIREWNTISRVQQLDTDFSRRIADILVFQESPRKAADGLAGVDELPGSGYGTPRAPKGMLAFQEYRIVTTVSNLSLNGKPLTCTQIGIVFDFLNSCVKSGTESPTWTDVKSLLGGGTLTGYGDRKPPINTTHAAMSSLTGDGKAIATFWVSSDYSARSSLVDAVMGVRDLDPVTDTDVIDFIETLSEEQVLALESVSLESGRAAHCVDNLTSITEHILRTGSNLHDARKVLFGISDSWKPSPPELGTLTGNPTVDANIVVVKRIWDEIVSEFGVPDKVVVESTRDLTLSGMTAARVHADNQKRADSREKSAAMFAREHGLTTSSLSRVQARRLEIFQEQNGSCLYCGTAMVYGAMEIDHIVPVSCGGGNQRLNLAGACRSCNSSKGDQPLTVWHPNISQIEKRVKAMSWTMGMSGAAAKAYTKKYVAHLSETEGERNIESVSWAVTEICDQLRGVCANTIHVPGKATAATRKIGDLNDVGLVCVDNGKGKSRVDRRHHAVDAAVITVLSPVVVDVLSQRNLLRSAAELSGGEVSWFENGQRVRGVWKSYTGTTSHERATFDTFVRRVKGIRSLVENAVSNDSVPVVHLRRVRPDGVRIHEDTLQKLTKLPVTGAFTKEDVQRLSDPQVWRALQTFVTAKGSVDEDHERVLFVRNVELKDTDTVTRFPTNGGAMVIGGGFCEAPRYHHLRVWEENGKLRFVRVYLFDAQRLYRQGKDMFNTPLDASTLSMRDSGVREHPGSWKSLLIGDTIRVPKSALHTPRDGKITAAAQSRIAILDNTSTEYVEFVLRSIKGDGRLAVAPSMLASDDGVNLGEAITVSAAAVLRGSELVHRTIVGDVDTTQRRSRAAGIIA